MRNIFIIIVLIFLSFRLFNIFNSDSLRNSSDINIEQKFNEELNNDKSFYNTGSDNKDNLQTKKSDNNLEGTWSNLNNELNNELNNNSNQENSNSWEIILNKNTINQASNLENTWDIWLKIEYKDILSKYEWLSFSSLSWSTYFWCEEIQTFLEENSNSWFYYNTCRFVENKWISFFVLKENWDTYTYEKYYIDFVNWIHLTYLIEKDIKKWDNQDKNEDMKSINTQYKAKNDSFSSVIEIDSLFKNIP